MDSKNNIYFSLKKINNYARSVVYDFVIPLYWARLFELPSFSRRFAPHFDERLFFLINQSRRRLSCPRPQSFVHFSRS